MKRILNLLLACCLLWSCEVENLHEAQENRPPTASFEPSTINCFPPCEIVFNNLSTNAVSYLWNFGDGTTSTEFSPTHTYTTEGDFNCELTVFNNIGTASSLTRQITVTNDTGGGSETFAKSIEQTDSIPQVKAMCLANDGGYVVVGQNGDTGFLVKTNEQGDVQLSKVIGFLHFQRPTIPTRSNDVVASTSGYAVCGSYNNNVDGEDYLRVDFINDSGGIEWIYEHPEPDTEGFYIINTDDGGHLIVGMQGSMFSNYWEKVVVIRLLGGYFMWQYTIEDASYAFEVFNEGDGTYSILFALPDGISMQSIDDDGTPIERILLPDLNISGYIPYCSGIRLENGHYAFAPLHENTAVTAAAVQLHNDDGSSLWISDDLSDAFLYDIQSTTDGGIIACGRFYNGSSYDAFLIKFDTDGNEIWRRQHGGALSEEANAMAVLPDGSLILVGVESTISTTDELPGDRGIYLLKLKSDGTL